MAKAVRGYQADDGTFFRKLEDATLHEATQHLKLSCEGARIKSEAMLTFINSNLEQVDSYVKAVLALSPSAFNRTANGGDTEDGEGGKENVDGLQQQ